MMIIDTLRSEKIFVGTMAVVRNNINTYVIWCSGLPELGINIKTIEVRIDTINDTNSTGL